MGPDEIIALIDSGEMRDWENELSLAERQLLHMARAFVTDYECLILHRPLDFLHADAAKYVAKMMREFVDTRGVDQASDFKSRRPRTCFFSTASDAHKDFCDGVYIMEEHGIIRDPSTSREVCAGKKLSLRS